MLWVTKRTIDSEPVSFKEGFTPKSCLQGDLEEVSDQPPPPNRKVWEALGQGEPLPLLRVCPGKLGSLLHFLPLPGTRQRKELLGCCFSAIPFPLSPSLLFFFLLLHMEINIIFKKSIRKVLSAKKKMMSTTIHSFTHSFISSVLVAPHGDAGLCTLFHMYRIPLPWSNFLQDTRWSIYFLSSIHPQTKIVIWFASYFIQILLCNLSWETCLSLLFINPNLVLFSLPNLTSGTLFVYNLHLLTNI